MIEFQFYNKLDPGVKSKKNPIFKSRKVLNQAQD